MTLATIIGTAIIVAVTIVIGVVVDRKIGILPRPEKLAELPARSHAPSYAAGEAPVTAIRAGGVQLDRLRGSQRCKTCREPLSAVAEDQVRYNDHDLVVLQFRCPRCDTKRALYVEPAA